MESIGIATSEAKKRGRLILRPILNFPAKTVSSGRHRSMAKVRQMSYELAKNGIEPV